MPVDSDKKFLQDLNEDIWCIYQHPEKGLFSVPDISRELTQEELNRIVKISNRKDLLFIMGNADFGFTLELTICEILTPIYPGIENLPSPLCKIISRHLPNFEWDEAWEFFNQFTHSDENIQKLKKERISMELDRSYYEY